MTETLRTGPEQLQSYEDLCSVLAANAPRVIAPEKESMHYVDLSTGINLLRAFDLPMDFFLGAVPFEAMKDTGFYSKVTDVYNDLVEHIIVAQDDADKQKLCDALYDYLSEEDVPEKSDIIFVFGSKQTFRVQKAIDLYKQGLAPRICISGKSPFYELGSHQEPEAEVLGRYALEQGVPREALILEKESISLPDNVKRSLNLLKQEGIPHASIILANSPFTQRRGWAHFNKLSAVGTKLYRANVDTVTPRFSKQGWYHDEVGTRVIIKELYGLWVSAMINTA